MTEVSSTQLRARQEEILGRIRNVNTQLEEVGIALAAIPFEPELNTPPELIAQRAQQRIELQRQRAQLEQQVRQLRAELLAVPEAAAEAPQQVQATTTTIRQSGKISPATYRSVESVSRALQEAQARQKKSQQARSSTLNKLSKKIKHTSYIIFMIVLYTAFVLDVVGVLKLSVEEVPYLGAIVGVVVNVITTPIALLFVTIPTAIAQWRIKRISKNSEALVKYTGEIRQELKTLHTRLKPAMRQLRRSYLIQATDPDGVGGVKEFIVYRSRILLNSVIVLLLESIPYVDAGPWQSIKVWQVYVAQQKEFRKARAVLLEARAVDGRISMLERFEMEFLKGILKSLLDRIAAARRALAAQEALEWLDATASPSYAYRSAT